MGAISAEGKTFLAVAAGSKVRANPGAEQKEKAPGIAPTFEPVAAAKKVFPLLGLLPFLYHRRAEQHFPPSLEVTERFKSRRNSRLEKKATMVQK